VPAAYHFVDRWFVPFPVEDVYDVIGDATAYPTWWGDVFLEIGGDDGPPRPGRRSTITAKGFLPYKLQLQERGRRRGAAEIDPHDARG
jgi:hypothetical protein